MKILKLAVGLAVLYAGIILSKKVPEFNDSLASDSLKDHSLIR